MSKYDKWYIIGKLLCSTFRICKKSLQICKNWIFYCKIQLYSKNVCKKKLSKKWEIIHFKKPLTMPFQICKKICKILNKGCLQKNLQFFRKINNLCQWLSKKLNFIKIWQVEVGQNKDLVCYRKIAVIQAVCLRTQAVNIKARF